MEIDEEKRKKPDRIEELDLADRITHLLEECRMVLPGIQALFGFQLIAAFNDGFAKRLDPWQQEIHLAALLLVSVAIALVMAPASLHRQSEQGLASEMFLRVTSRLLVAAMIPLAVAISLEVFLVADVIWHNTLAAAVAASALTLLFAGVWFVFPARYRVEKRRRILAPPPVIGR
jgi:hypothetical protein